MPGANWHETKELDIEEPDALVLASMELGNDPNAMEPDTHSNWSCVSSNFSSSSCIFRIKELFSIYKLFRS
jgi:hypothetical protein